MSSPGQQQNAQIAAQPQQTVAVTENELQRNKQELGMLGNIFGSSRNAPYYSASIVIFICAGFLCYVIVSQPQNQTGMTLLGTIVTGGLGYLFGRSSAP
jgi:lipoprotein signal peptidase